MRLEQIDLDTWASELPSSGFEVFHTAPALRVLEEYTAAEMRLYAGYKGEEVVALLPLFVDRKALGWAALSPPPSMSVSRLGPLIMANSPKQRKQESVNNTFVEMVIEDVDASSVRSLVRMECPLGYDDPRPFAWSDLVVEPRFTYVLDLADSDTDAVLDGFSSGLRREIRDGRELDVTVGVEGIEGAIDVYHDIDDRYGEQDEVFPISESFYRDLLDGLGDRWRAYVARDADGEFLGGITVLYSNDLAYFWQGGARTDRGGVSINSLLHWRIIKDVLEDPPRDSVAGYDLIGANTPRLCRYKAKFGADLAPYYVVESPGIGMAAAKRAYQIVSK
jgi:hypothetical protein